MVITFDLVGECMAVRGSESVPVADTPKAGVDHIIQHRPESITEAEANARLVVGFELSASQEHIFESSSAFRKIDLIVDEFEETPNFDGKPLSDTNVKFRIKLKTVAP